MNKPKTPSPEKTKTANNKVFPSSIFVPPPTIPNSSNVRIGAHIEIGRLELEDLAGKEYNSIYESYINDLIEEVIQSDFEKPSIPEVILAVITDLTNDEDEDNRNKNPQYTNNAHPVYNFSQDKTHLAPQIMYNNGTANNDIDNYYTHVHQTVVQVNGSTNHDSVRSTNSSNPSAAVPSQPDPAAVYLTVRNFHKLLALKKNFVCCY